jgi:hypothetical protein
MNTQKQTFLQHSCKILFTSVCILMMIYSCRDDGPVQTVYLNDNFKEFIYFKEGTEWTYMHTEDSSVETATVVKSEVEIVTSSREEKLLAYVETFTYNVYSSRLGFTVEYYGRATGTGYLDEEYLKNERDRPYYLCNRQVGSTFSQIFYYYPHIGHEGSPMGRTKVTIAEHYDSLKVGERHYHDVYRIHETNNQIEGAKETNFYVARGYGIIRKEINNKREPHLPDDWEYWDLIESTIIQ